jgi:hypothetical protein
MNKKSPQEIMKLVSMRQGYQAGFISADYKQAQL